MKKARKALSFLLCLVLIVGILPVSVLAEGEDVAQVGAANISSYAAAPQRIIRPGDTVTQTYNFYAGETLYHTETIQSGDTLPDPGVPAGDGEFLGWYVEDAQLDFGEKTFAESSTINVTAKFRGVNYFYFMSGTDDDAIVVATKVLHEND